MPAAPAGIAHCRCRWRHAPARSVHLAPPTCDEAHLAATPLPLPLTCSHALFAGAASPQFFSRAAQLLNQFGWVRVDGVGACGMSPCKQPWRLSRLHLVGAQPGRLPPTITPCLHSCIVYIDSHRTWCRQCRAASRSSSQPTLLLTPFSPSLTPPPPRCVAVLHCATVLCCAVLCCASAGL